MTISCFHGRRGRACAFLVFPVVLLLIELLPSAEAQIVAGFTAGNSSVNDAGAETYSIPIQTPQGLQAWSRSLR